MTTIDWATRVISIPKADMSLVQSSPIEIRELNINTFRLTLKDIEDDMLGIPHNDTHRHNTIVTVGGVTLARVVEILEPYTITFEDGAYAVNLVGANSNISDKVNLNTVSIRATNSAGLTQPVTPEDMWGVTLTDFTTAGTAGKVLKDKLTRNEFIALK